MPTESVLSGHRKFRSHFKAEARLFARLAEEGQNPKVMWIGCSDSRVIPNQLAGAEPGELFVVRNVANVVPPHGALHHAVGAAVEYAVLHLRLEHIVVCGHTDCGGIKALEQDLSPAREPHAVHWTDLIRPAVERVAALGVPEASRHLEIVRENALLQRRNLSTYPCVQDAVDAGRLALHAWLYELATGELWAFSEENQEWAHVNPPEEEED